VTVTFNVPSDLDVLVPVADAETVIAKVLDPPPPPPPPEPPHESNPKIKRSKVKTAGTDLWARFFGRNVKVIPIGNTRASAKSCTRWFAARPEEPARMVILVVAGVDTTGWTVAGEKLQVIWATPVQEKEMVPPNPAVTFTFAPVIVSKWLPGVAVWLVSTVICPVLCSAAGKEGRSIPRIA